jgi:hypothetical protein
MQNPGPTQLLIDLTAKDSRNAPTAEILLTGKASFCFTEFLKHQERFSR